MGFWSVFGIVLTCWVGLVVSIGITPFSFILGKELALAFCQIASSVKRRIFSFGNTTASYRLAMLAAAQQPENWEVKDFTSLTHPEVGKVNKSRGHSYIGFQAISHWQFDKIYQTVLDGQAMVKMRRLTEVTAKELYESVGKLQITV